jgi:hypothetical protein
VAAFDGDPFKRVIRHVRGEESIKPGDAGVILSGYLRGMEQLVGYLDRYQPPSAL